MDRNIALEHSQHCIAVNIIFYVVAIKEKGYQKVYVRKCMYSILHHIRTPKDRVKICSRYTCFERAWSRNFNRIIRVFI